MEYPAPFRSEMVRPNVRGVSPYCGHLPFVHNGPQPKAFFGAHFFEMVLLAHVVSLNSDTTIGRIPSANPLGLVVAGIAHLESEVQIASSILIPIGGNVHCCLTEEFSSMENSSFPQSAKPQVTPNNRRSTRVDFVTTVFISGKDSTGTPFREFTQTTSVNMHGCRVRTAYGILVGMLVIVECPQAGTWGKGICIRVWDALPGVIGHEIAIQLTTPQNLWGVPNPPADWEEVAKACGQGAATRAENFATSTAVSAPRAASTSQSPPPVQSIMVAQSPMSAAATAAPTAVFPITSVATAPAWPRPEGGAANEDRLADLDRRAKQIVELALDSLRRQAEEYVRSSLGEFHQRMDALIRESEARIRQDLQQSYENSAGSLIALRTDLTEQMAARGSQLIRSLEDILRARLLNDRTLHDEPVSLRSSKADANE